MAVSNSEIKNILSVIRANEDLHEDMALATVVDVEGSAYRRTGARMLIQSNGNWTGSISGGCLEGNALRRAREVIREKQPQLLTYDTRNDADAKALGASLGCNGIIQVWLEPLIGFGAIDFLEHLDQTLMGEKAIWFSRELRGPNCGRFEEIRPSDQIEEGLQKDARLAVEEVLPALRLLIFGAGDDAKPLSQLAKQMGWRVILLDECQAKTLPVRFPDAEQVLTMTRENPLASLDLNARTAAVLLSHNYGLDMAVLQALLPKALPYIGMLGPKKRFERMNEELGGVLSKHPEIHAPIGLDIGAQTPFEIALAIVAEIQARFSNRKGGSLRDRKGTIHGRKPKEQ